MGTELRFFDAGLRRLQLIDIKADIGQPQHRADAFVGRMPQRLANDRRTRAGNEPFFRQGGTSQLHQARHVHDIAMHQLRIVDVGMQAHGSGQRSVIPFPPAQGAHQGLDGEACVEGMDTAGLGRIHDATGLHRLARQGRELFRQPGLDPQQALIVTEHADLLLRLRGIDQAHSVLAFGRDLQRFEQGHQRRRRVMQRLQTNRCLGDLLSPPMAVQRQQTAAQVRIFDQGFSIGPVQALANLKRRFSWQGIGLEQVFHRETVRQLQGRDLCAVQVDQIELRSSFRTIGGVIASHALGLEKVFQRTLQPVHMVEFAQAKIGVEKMIAGAFSAGGLGHQHRMVVRVEHQRTGRDVSFECGSDLVQVGLAKPRAHLAQRHVPQGFQALHKGLGVGLSGFEYCQEEALAQVPGGDVTLGKRRAHHQRQGIATPTNRLAIAAEQQILGDHLDAVVAESVQHLRRAFNHLEAVLKGRCFLDSRDMTPPLEQRPRLLQGGFLQRQRAVGRQRRICQIAHQAVHEPGRLALEHLPLDNRITAGHALFDNAVGEVLQLTGNRAETLVIQGIQAK
ncbi:hypothetical protein BSG18_49900 [Pseudomonas ogarae]|nr:hypothetical protein BSG18_49900 [Pseudomonas ogarae]